ncbi:MAG TPA: hypothetical protein VG605_01665 [Puia sp.]|nr:hypothetical protein [Puia sp.]
MIRSNLLTRLYSFRPLVSGILGIALMLPAVVFLCSLVARLCGARTAYYYIAPSFLQSPFDPFALHKAQVIIGSLLIAAGFNAYRRSWLNTAIVLQSALLLLVLAAYIFIQHLRY